MFDNLRDSASSFYEEEPNDLYKEPEVSQLLDPHAEKVRVFSG